MSTKVLSNPFAALTWDDVEAWAGSRIVSRGKSYQRSNRVQKLARTAGGGIVAWVQGTSRYASAGRNRQKEAHRFMYLPVWRYL